MLVTVVASQICLTVQTRAGQERCTIRPPDGYRPGATLFGCRLQCLCLRAFLRLAHTAVISLARKTLRAECNGSISPVWGPTPGGIGRLESTAYLGERRGGAVLLHA